MDRGELVRRKLAIQSEILAGKRRNKLSRYLPYPKQFAFHKAGVSFRERLLMAGNQLGKTFGAGFEVAMHATGRYPDWWPGRRFDKPVLVWTGSPTNETSKEIIQPILLGTESPSKSHPDFGTGAIPGDDIVTVTTRQAGVKGVVDEIIVKHVSGGFSRIALKTYEQGRTKWQGKPVDIIWPDEEPEDAALYTEAVTRTQATGGMVMMTFTPLLGMSSVVEGFMDEGNRQKNVTTMTIYDAIGGTWTDGPWEGQEWTGHYTKEEADRIVSEYPEHERETRALGIPMMGEGKVFPVKESLITVDPFEVPRHFAQIAGCDFGIDHPAAGVRLAWDRDNDVVYLTACYKRSGETPAYHAPVFRMWGQWIPVMWPHDGLNKEKSSGATLADSYIAHGANMFPFSARYDDQKGGRQDIEPAVLEIYERMKTGRFLVFSNCSDFFEEFRMYHRKDGKIVARNDDVISALRYAIMMLRHARTNVQSTPRQRYTRPVVEQFA